MDVNSPSYDTLQDKVGYHFKNKSLMVNAFVHRSLLNEEQVEDLESNERLEFLGDAVLELIVSDLLFRHYPDSPEGALTEKRIRLVNGLSFAYLARSWNLNDYILLGHGEEKQGGRDKDSLLSDTFEAFCGAIYLDGGYDFLYQKFSILLPDLEEKEKDAHLLFRNYKSVIQEEAQKRGDELSYIVERTEGPDHKRTFYINLYVNGKKLAEGVGPSKKQAEQAAAQKALEKYDRNWSER